MKIDNYDLSFFFELPTCSCIYLLLKGEEVVYVGRSKNLYERLTGHREKDYDRVFFFPVEEGKLSDFENFYISKYDPPYNKTGGIDLITRQPRGRPTKYERNRAIRAAYEGGASAVAIASLYGISRQRVFQILSR